MLDKILPVIRTCPTTAIHFESFVDSYTKRLKEYLSPPVVSIDLTRSSVLPLQYLEGVCKVDPCYITLHAKSNVDLYFSVQDGAWWAIRKAYNHAKNFDYILFLEDDIEFSSQVIPAIKKANFDTSIGYYSFYIPFGGFNVDKLSREQLFSGYFFGSQCLMMPMTSVKILIDNEKYIRENYPYGCDLQWSRFLFEQKKYIWTSVHSYVQHISSESRLNNTFHKSYCYVT
jgi:hypothetical protein